MHRSLSHLLRCILVASSGCALPAVAQTPEVSNPFADFESFMLPNGLTVWYRHLPGSATTSMAVIVPAGWDDDPPGAAQTAHLLEHVLLSDRSGRTEAELARELTSRGGTHNGITAPDHGYYPVHIGTGEAAFALQWLHDVVAPRAFTDALVERNREPVVIEVGARRHSFLERLVLRFIHLPALRPAGFWEREFGLHTAADRMVDTHASLHAISAADLQQFYDRHYATSTMKLVVVSGLPRAALQPVINETFARLPWRPPADRPDSITPRQGESRRFSYQLGRSTHLGVFHRLGTLTERDLLRLTFIEDLLRLRLTERLRRGADKSVYSVNVSTETRRDAAFLRIAVDVDPAQERRVRAAIEEELQRLRTAQVDTAAFYADRNALEQRLRVQSAAPGRLVEWAANRFYRPALHDDFPDVGEYYATVGADSIAALAQRVLTPDNRIVRVLRPPPIGFFWIALLALLSAASAAALYRMRVYREADMGTIRFVARIRRSLRARATFATALLVFLLILGRLLAAAVQFAAELVILPIDSPSLHALAAAALIAAVTWALLAIAGLLPGKVLVFEREIRLKSPTWRAIVIPGGEVTGVRIVRSAKGLPLRRPAWPGSGVGVFIERIDGSGHLVHVRRPDALRAAVENLRARSSIQAV